MKHKSICIFLILSVLFSLPFSVFATGKDSFSVWDGSVAESFECGDGSEQNPFVIKNAEQLAYFAQSVNGGNSYKDKVIELHTDIDLANINWTPIGTAEKPFEGTFSGNNKTVTRIYISAPDETRKGLFGCIRGGEIYGVVLRDSEIECDEIAGGIVAENEYGSVENCRNYAAVAANNTAGGIVGRNLGGKISGCNNFGFIYSSTAGGIAGQNAFSDGRESNISENRNLGTIVGGSDVGGIVGSHCDSSVVKDCINSGRIVALYNVGGIAGVNEKGDVSACRNNGKIISEGEKSYAGGIVGNSLGGKIENSYNSGDIYGISAVGGILGGGSGEIKYCYSVGVASGSEIIGAIVGEKGELAVGVCYYLIGGAADGNGNTLFGIGNTDSDPASVTVYGNETMKSGEAYVGFDFNIWTTGGSVDYNYPELNSLVLLDNEYIKEYGYYDSPADESKDTPTESEAPAESQSETEHNDGRGGGDYWWIWVVVGGCVILIAVLFAANKR